LKKVIVVESGAKTKTIRRCLRGEYKVVACGGNIVELPKDCLGIDADEIYLATDLDREGEAIAADPPT